MPTFTATIKKGKKEGGRRACFTSFPGEELLIVRVVLPLNENHEKKKAKEFHRLLHCQDGEKEKKE